MLFNKQKKNLAQEREILEFLDKNEQTREELLRELNLADLIEYKYDIGIALEELGVEEELMGQLLKDFIKQISTNKQIFFSYAKSSNFESFKELTHKNLGVARNLRIKDCEVILKEMMQTQDIQKIVTLLDALECCVIRLKPRYSYYNLGYDRR